MHFFINTYFDVGQMVSLIPISAFYKAVWMYLGYITLASQLAVSNELHCTKISLFYKKILNQLSIAPKVCTTKSNCTVWFKALLA